MYEWKAPSGVVVHSEVPPTEDKWLDHPVKAVWWSYQMWYRTIRRWYRGGQ